MACLPNPYKLSILGDIWRATILPFPSSKYFYSRLRLSNLVDLLFEHLSFSNKRKTTILFSSPLTFLQWSMGYSRKNTHLPDGWQTFLTPPPDWISQTAWTPLPPRLPSSRTPLPPGFPVFLKGPYWKQHAIENTQHFIQKIPVYYNFKSSLNIAGWISTFFETLFKRSSCFCAKNTTCLHVFLYPQQIYNIRNS